MAKLNRQDFKSELQYLKDSHMYSPPYKTDRTLYHKSQKSLYDYPRQLSGIKDAGQQKIRIAGSTDGSGQGTTPYAGMPTGSTYLT